jgi:hypothetical protein
MKTSCVFLVATGLILATPTASLAGTFVMQRVWADTWYPSGNQQYFTVVMNGEAKYLGSVDANDSHWYIQTDLYHSQWGWVAAGFGNNGSGTPYTNMLFKCIGGCAASYTFETPSCLANPIYYQGRGGVTIYHQYNPEISILWGPWKALPCDHGCGDPE